MLANFGKRRKIWHQLSTAAAPCLNLGRHDTNAQYEWKYSQEIITDFEKIWSPQQRNLADSTGGPLRPIVWRDFLHQSQHQSRGTDSTKRVPDSQPFVRTQHTAYNPPQANLQHVNCCHNLSSHGRSPVPVRTENKIPDRTETSNPILAASLIGGPLVSTEGLSWGPVDLAIKGINGLANASDLPWWFVLALTAAGVRTLLLPLVIQQLKSTAANVPLFQQALKKSKKDGDSKKPNVKSLRTEFDRLRRGKNLPSPAWIFVGPIVQLPVFITLVMAVRRMAGVPWPGFESGGLAWFSDLTLTSVKWSEAGLMAPMGPYGIILPAAVTGLMFANLQIGFAKPGKGANETQSVRTLTGSFKLFLEWLTISALIIAMQLPQAVLVYWSASSSFVLAQTSLLKLPVIRQRILPAKKKLDKPLPPSEQMSDSEIEQKMAEMANDDVDDLFQQVAEWRAEGQLSAATKLLKLITQRAGDDLDKAYAWSKLGFVFKEVREYKQAEHAFLETTKLETNEKVLAQVWFEAGCLRVEMKKLDSKALQAAVNSVDYGLKLLSRMQDPTYKEELNALVASKEELKDLPRAFREQAISKGLSEQILDVKSGISKAYILQAILYRVQYKRKKARTAIQEAMRFDSAASDFAKDFENC